jgi:hypothetical protein
MQNLQPDRSTPTSGAIRGGKMERASFEFLPDATGQERENRPRNRRAKSSTKILQAGLHFMLETAICL